MPAEPIEIRRKRLLYMATHRGFKEADILLGGFATQALPTMGVDEMDEFEALLSLSDHDIYGWIIGNLETPANLKGPVFDRICAFDAAAITAPR